jgi:hypothetical protein
VRLFARHLCDGRAIARQPDGIRLRGVGRRPILKGDDRCQQLQREDQSSRGYSLYHRTTSEYEDRS